MRKFLKAVALVSLEGGVMNQQATLPVWRDVKRRLKKEYNHLNDRDLAEFENHHDDWLDCVQRRAGGSYLAIAHLVDEVIARRRWRTCRAMSEPFRPDPTSV